MKPLLFAVLCLAGGLACAEPADERTRLATERLAVTQRFDQEEQACTLRFASTGCLADVRARRRDAMAPLRERELTLADQDRQQRAQDRRRAVAAKQQAAGDRPTDVPAPVLRLRQPPAPAQAASAAYPPRAGEQAARESEAAMRSQANASRQADIEADKKRVADRVAARASEGKPVQPLPALPAMPARGASQRQR